MAEKESSKLLKYMPFTSLIEPTFWHKFCDLKLEVDKLNEKERFLWGYYFKEYNNPTLSINCSSFNNEYENHTNSLCAHGFHINKNTVESFKECDKQILLQQYGQYFRENIISGKALNDPSLLVTFILLTFADFKKFHFYYWFAFPASLKTLTNLCSEPVNMSSLFTTEQIKNIFQSHASLSYSQKGFFGIIHIEDMLHVCTLKEIVQHLNSEKKNEKSYIGFVDPNSEELNPGWPLRNLLYLLAHYCPESMFGSEIEVICLRKLESSIVLTLQLSDNVGDQSEKFVGWEKNQRGKFGPRFVDLSETMDPIKLAERSVDLNLKLMKWRLVPNLDLSIIQSTKCLLLGAGTLGCSVARSLLAWGVKKITFVDSGRVSYSNPVRQSLFTFEDCKNGGGFKAEIAAKALSRIYPGVDASGVVLAIPMPGHGLADVENINPLQKLISSHDVIYFLTDSRESRWLPTLVVAQQRKIGITAALGFDTYLVLRHGISRDESHTNKLGCYFCNDITAPGNSSADRTLDQQCTVTRPAVSVIAASIAVEIMVSILQHSSRGSVGVDEPTCLGPIPHSIRGFLSSYSCIQPSTSAFSQCIACSSKVIKEYEDDRMVFLKKVLENATYLEDLTGLTEMHKATESTEIWALDDEDDSFDE